MTSASVATGSGRLTAASSRSNRARDGTFIEDWHEEDAPGMLRQLGLEPPPAIMRLAARHSARRYRRQRHPVS